MDFAIDFYKNMYFIRIFIFFDISISACTWRFSINVQLSEKFEVRLHWTHSISGSAMRL